MLLHDGQLIFDGEKYKYVEKAKAEFGVFIKPVSTNNILIFDKAVNIFLNNYAKVNCTPETYRTYVSIFKMNILPFFKNLKI